MGQVVRRIEYRLERSKTEVRKVNNRPLSTAYNLSRRINDGRILKGTIPALAHFTTHRSNLN